MKNRFTTALLRLVLSFGIVAVNFTASSQISGIKTIPTDYASIAAFITDLNTQGVGPGGVTLNIPSGYTETAPAGGFSINTTASGSLANQVIIQGVDPANKPIITASPSHIAGALNDAVFKIIGADFVTLANLDLRENAGNTTTTAASNNMTEWGIALLYASTTDNAQNVRIIGNVISLGATYQNAFGVYANATHTASAVATPSTATGLAGGHNGLEVKGNTISSVNMGIVVVGPTAAADHNDGVTIGGASAAEGNTITYGLTGTLSSYANVSATVNGILVRNSKNVIVRNNTLTSNGTVTGGTLNGIHFPAFSLAPTGAFTQNVSDNIITLRANATASAVNGINQPSGSASTTSTFICDNNNFNGLGHTIASPTAPVVGIILTSTHQTNSISGNRFNNLTVTSTGNFTFISNSINTPVGGSQAINNNQIVGTFNKTGGGGTVVIFTSTAFTPAGRTISFSNNNFSNITLTGATTMAGLNLIDGNTATDGPIKTVTGNTFNNWTCGTSAVTGMQLGYSGNTAASIAENNIFSNITGQGNVTAVNLNNNGSLDFRNNQIFGISSTGAGTSVTLTGISAGTNNVNVRIQKNKIYGLSANNATNTTTPAVNGILVTAGTATNIENNLIAQLTANVAPSTDAIRGISITSTATSSAINVFHNTIYLNASSTGLNFGTTGIFHTASGTATTASLNLRNNIIINESTPAGTGLTVVFRRNAPGANNLAASSNRNLLFAGTPGANNLIYTDGTTPQQTLLGYQTAVLPAGHDANSFTGEAFTYGAPGSFFISLTGSSSDFLRPVAGIVTQTESGADVIAGLTVDYANSIRGGNAGYAGTGSNPDVGALEFEGISPAPVIALNSVTPPASAQCVTAPRLVSVSITTLSGTITAANIVYSINGTPQASVPMTNTSGNIWEGTIPASSPVNATIAWGVAATNSIGLSSSYTGSTYTDEPLLGVTGTASASVATVCSNDPVQLSASIVRSGSVNSGVGGGASSAIALSPFYHLYGGAKTQYIIRATELTAMGLTAGDITSLAVNITTLGTPTLNGFSISIGNTAQNTAVANTAITSGLTQVYSNAAQALTLGANTYNFSTPFNWNGSSNIVISFSYSNNNAGGTSSAVTTDPALSFTSSMAIVADNATATCLLGAVSTADACMGTTTTNQISATRPRFIITGNTAPAITSVQWFDGPTSVGTGNPLTVNPSVTTTYTANVTAAGCVLTPAPTATVNVNPLPSAPTATNSAQCGTQIPTASVTSTSGLPTPSFKWYDAPTAGNMLQNSTSTTYTSNVASTTTFYVAEVNTTTGCESARVAVTITVAAADNISASASVSSLCIGGSSTLSVVNSNPTPNQNYVYTWTGAANSGITAPTNGASVAVSPTAAGTFVYDVTGVDGLCNAFAQVTVIIEPFVAVISPINVSCNGGNDGSFSLVSTSCGTAPFSYSIDGGAFGAIPSNLAAGTYAVVVRDANNFLSSSLTLTITQPSTTITNPTVTNASVCQDATSAAVTASATLSTTTALSQAVSFNLSAQPNEVNVGPGVVISSATLPVLPAGAVITGLTLASNGIIPNGGEYQTDVKLGLSGAFINTAVSGTGLIGFGTVSGVPYNYTRNIPVAGFPTNGGTINLVYWNDFNDIAGGPDATFPLGSNAVTLTIDYTVPTPATISWWDAPTGGNQIGTGSPFETVGTSVLPTTATPGVYTVYAQGQNGACPSPGRTAATVTVKAKTFNTINQTACNSFTLNTQTYTATGTYTQTLTNAAGCDSIITLNLIINNSNGSTTSITACNSYTWTNGTTYTASGAYSQTLTNIAGCDSVATLNLTINNSNTGTDVITACDAYTWINGVTYTANNNTATFTLTNAAGCDSVVTLNLTINNSNTGTDVITACDSYTWIDGVTYTASNNSATFTLTNAAGCDSVVTLNLTINNSNTGTDVIAACDSYTWIDGVTYTASNNSATFTLTNAAGCDSVVTLNLTINNSNTGTDVVTACGSYTWIDGVTYTADNSTATFVLTNAAGCDSTVTLNLTLLNNTGTDVVTACETYTWIDGVTYTASNNTATFTLTNAAGCDSLVTLNLTINNSTTSTTTVAECGSYTWTDGVTYTTSGIYTQLLTNAAGCDSTAVLELTINPFPVATATDNGDGTITASSGASYQWINCATGQPLNNETAQTFVPSVNGSYQVVVTTASGCADTSDCVVIDYIGLDEIVKTDISVYPNPTRDNVYVSMTAETAVFEVIDGQGKVLQTSVISTNGQIDLSSYTPGVYVIRINTGNESSIHRVVKN